MTTFTSVLKGYKKENAWEGGGSSSVQFQVLSAWSQVNLPESTSVHPGTGLA